MKSLDRLGPDDATLSGGKAWNCGRLKQAGFAVPDGLVIPATATDEEVAAVAAHAWFDEAPPHARFAVRSSGIDEDGASHSFAGVHETRLNVPRHDVPAAAAASRASARSPQAPAYRRSVGLDAGDARMAVLVQHMVPAAASGVAFTVNPVTGADDELVINATKGLGEPLVSGAIAPDEIHVRKHDRALLSARPGGAASQGLSLDPSQIAALAELLVSIERFYGAPQDVEWSYDGARFWVLQSRPVTTRPSPATGPEWTRANLAEVLPDLTSPQALASFEDMLNAAQRAHMRGLTAPEHALGPMFKSFYGRLYFNLSQLRHICAMSGTPAASMLRSLGHPGEIRAEDERPASLSLRARITALPALIRLVGRHLRVKRLLRAHDARIATFLARMKAMDPEAASDAALWAVIMEWWRAAPETFQIVLTLGGVLFYEEQLRSICRKAGSDLEPLLLPQLAAGQRSVSAQQAFDLTALAVEARQDPLVKAVLSSGPVDAAAVRGRLQGTAFLAAFDRFLDTYGHRGRYESDWALPRYAEDPTPLLQAIRAHLDDADGRAGGDAGGRDSEAAEAWSRFERRLPALQRWMLAPLARRLVARIKQYYVWREHCRFEMIRAVAELRQWHLVLARRFAARGWLDAPQDYFMLLIDEVGAIVASGTAGSDVRAIVARRKAEQERYRRLTMPLLMREAELPELVRRAGLSLPGGDGELYGLTTSPGRVEGVVAVVHDPGDFERMKRGAILVTRATDPSWTPIFTLASGVIVEVGGLLSHASTVAREYGLPSLANVRDATRRLRTGERVLLDATGGFVRRLSAPASAGAESRVDATKPADPTAGLGTPPARGRP